MRIQKTDWKVLNLFVPNPIKLFQQGSSCFWKHYLLQDYNGRRQRAVYNLKSWAGDKDKAWVVRSALHPCPVKIVSHDVPCDPRLPIPSRLCTWLTTEGFHRHSKPPTRINSYTSYQQKFLSIIYTKRHFDIQFNKNVRFLFLTCVAK